MLSKTSFYPALIHLCASSSSLTDTEGSNDISPQDTRDISREGREQLSNESEVSSADSEVVDEVKLISMSSSCRGVDEHSGIEGDNESHLRISELQLST